MVLLDAFLQTTTSTSSSAPMLMPSRTCVKRHESRIIAAGAVPIIGMGVQAAV